MTVALAVSGGVGLSAGLLVLPGLGAILLASGVWQLSRGLKGLGTTNLRYDIVLRRRRTRQGRQIVIRGIGASMTFLGVLFLSMGVVRAIVILLG